MQICAFVGNILPKRNPLIDTALDRRLVAAQKPEAIALSGAYTLVTSVTGNDDRR